MAEADVEDPTSRRPQDEGSGSRVISLAPTMDITLSLSDLFQAAAGSMVSTFKVWTFWICFPFHQAVWSRLSTTARAAILHGSVVGFLWFHIILALATRCLPLQIALYPAIACLRICTSSGRTEIIVSVAFLGAIFLLVVDLSLIFRCHGITAALCFTANTAALSSHCISKLYPVIAIRPWLRRSRAILVFQQFCIKIWDLYRLYPIARRAHPWLQYLRVRLGSFFFITSNMHKKKTALFLHASVIAILLFHIIFALATDCLPMQIVLYPAISFLHIWASSGQTEIIVSAAFLGALVLIVVFVSIGAEGLHIGIMFMANVVAISFHCIWKLYTLAQPWLHRYWRKKLYPIAQPWLLQYLSTLAPAWLMQDEELGRLLLPRRHGGGRQAAAFPMREFTYDELRTITQDFRTMVGQGGFAQVFRGVVLDDDGTGTGTAVAVKRITTTTTTGGGDRPPDVAIAGHDDFLREISIVSNVHHRSLVRLLGYCLPRERHGGSSRYLVYPFFDNGSLDSWLFHGTQERRRLLPWPTRRCIAVDVAKALAYLHHECWQQILHLDVKPGNILLDGDLRAHLSDFGISMSITRDMSSVDTRGRGTPGYMAPEMLVNAVSAKSDVFSYGMTLLELVGGRRNFDPAATATDDAAASSSSATPDFTRDFFPYIVRDKMARGELMEAVDGAMALVDREEVEAVVKVALCCIQSRWDMRPTMLTVVDMLEGRVAADLPLQSRRLSTVSFSDLLSSSSPSSSSHMHGRVYPSGCVP